MANDSDKKRKLDDDNETLVKALESIKTLLATSEDKLNKARQSIDQASSYAIRDDNDIPVLEDIVVPGNTADNTEILDLSEEIANTAKQADRIIQQIDEQTLDIPTGLDEASLAQLRTELETEMKEKLTEFTTRLEEDLKARIQIYIERIQLKQEKK